MAWPPAVACRRIALVIFGLSLMLYTALSGMLVILGLDPRVTVIVAQVAVLFGLSLALARMLRLPLRQAFALRAAARPHWYMVFAAALPLQVAGGAMQFAVLRQLPEDSELRRLMEQVVNQFISVDTAYDLLMLFLAAVVIAAICEEFLFRGLLLQLMRRRAGWASAVVWSAALFAFYHLNPVVLLPITLVGAYLGVLVWRSGSLYPAVVAHALNNGLALFALPYLVDEAGYAENLGIVMVASMAVLGVLLFVYLRGTDPPPRQLDQEAEMTATEVGLSASQGGPPRPAAPRRPGVLEHLGVDGGLGDGE